MCLEASCQYSLRAFGSATVSDMRQAKGWVEMGGKRYVYIEKEREERSGE
ncbi:MAG: hypothetical protein ACK4HQ_09380 [Brevinematales bacterium]